MPTSGIEVDIIKKIYAAIKEKKYKATMAAFGMREATKDSWEVYEEISMVEEFDKECGSENLADALKDKEKRSKIDTYCFNKLKELMAGAWKQESRFIVLDVQTCDRSVTDIAKDTMFVMSWNPDDCKPKMKMLFASTSNSVKLCCPGVKTVENLTDVNEFIGYLRKSHVVACPPE